MTDCDTYRVPTPNGRSAVTGRFNPAPTAGDTTPISDEAITRLIKAFYEAHGVESWESSAEYRSGAEHHWMREAFAEIAPLLVSADSTQAERINAERREREALIGRLRAELADERTLSARYAAEVGRLCAELVDAEAQRVEMTTQRDLWRHDALAGDGRIDALSEKLRDRDAELAALRTAGGQEKPSGLAALLHQAFEYQWDQCDHGTYTGGPSHGEPYAMCERVAEHVLRTAPVDGQEKPNDEDISEAANKAEAVIAKWVDIAYRTMIAGLGDYGTEPEQRKAVEQMRHLYLAEPWLPARQIAAALAADPVGGQAEPSDEMVRAACEEAGWDWEPDLAEHVPDPVDVMRPIVAAALRVNPRPKDDMRLILHAALAVSGEHQDATKDAQ